MKRIASLPIVLVLIAACSAGSPGGPADPPPSDAPPSEGAPSIAPATAAPTSADSPEPTEALASPVPCVKQETLQSASDLYDDAYVLVLAYDKTSSWDPAGILAIAAQARSVGAQLTASAPQIVPEYERVAADWEALAAFEGQDWQRRVELKKAEQELWPPRDLVQQAMVEGMTSGCSG